MKNFSLLVASILWLVTQPVLAQEKAEKVAERSQAIIYAHEDTQMREVMAVKDLLLPKVDQLVLGISEEAGIRVKLFADVEEAAKDEMTRELKDAGVVEVSIKPYELEWIEFTPEKLEELKGSKNVVVFFRADWCLLCNQIEKESLLDADLLMEIRTLDLHLMRADLTEPDGAANDFAKGEGLLTVPAMLCFSLDDQENAKKLDSSQLFSGLLIKENLTKAFVPAKDSEASGSREDK